MNAVCVVFFLPENIRLTKGGYVHIIKMSVLE